MSELETGAVLQQRYRILRKLGEGGMGVVYEAQHMRIKRRVAIKVLHPQFAKAHDVLERFAREAEAASTISHPNIVEVTDYGETDDGAPFMVLEFLVGRNFSRDIAEQGPQPLGKVAHILCQVCRALHVAHSMGIVHRDLKPENIFLLEREGDPNYVKVLDFGISKFQKLNEAKASALTHTGALMGTPHFMAPEQCQGAAVDSRADLYALGVTLYQALTGRHPFDAELVVTLLMEICTRPAPSVAMYRAELPPEIVALVAKLLQKNPADRPSSCLEIEAVLRPFVGDTREPVMVEAQQVPRTEPHVVVPAPTPGSTAHTVAIPELHTPHPPTQYGVPSAPASGQRLGVFVAAGAALLFVALLVGAISFFALGSESEELTATPLPEAEPTVASAATPQPETPQPETAPAIPEPATVRVRIAVTPPEAELLLDGQPVSNPYDATLPQSSQPRTLLARAQGYQPIEQSLTLTQAQELELSLTPVVHPQPQVAQQGSTSTERHRSRTAVVAPRVTPLAPQSTRPRGARAASGNAFGL